MRARIGIVALGVVIFIVGIIGIAGTKTTPQDQTCVSYGGGPFEGKKFQGLHEPGKGIFVNGLFDKLYCYPVTQRSFIISRDQNADFETPVVAPSSDNIDTSWEISMYFRLNTSKTREFHESIGFKTEAYTDEGWFTMLQEYFRPQIQGSVRALAPKYTATELYANQEVFTEVENELERSVPDDILDTLGDDYFVDFSVSLKNIDIPEELKEKLKEKEASEIAIGTKQNEVRQAELEAEAIEKRQKAFEDCDTCILYEAIKSGNIDFWVIPGDQGLTLQTPQRSLEE